MLPYYLLEILAMTRSLLNHILVRVLPIGYNFKNKPFGEWVIITGATDGIGLSFAKCFAEFGNKILLISRSEQKLQKVQQQLVSNYKTEVDYRVYFLNFDKSFFHDIFNVYTLYLQIDFSLPAATYIDRLRSKLHETRPDGCSISDSIAILINNVGQLPYAYDTLTEAIQRAEIANPNKRFSEIFETSININCMSQMAMTAEIMELMRNKQTESRKKGAILSLSSYTGRTPCPFWVGYTACKGLNAAFSDSLARETGLLANDIIFTTIHPMEVSTSMSGAKWKDQYPIRCPPSDTYVKSAVKLIGVEQKISGWWAHDIRERINRFIGN